MRHAVVMIGVCALSQLTWAQPDRRGKPPVAFPHPMLSEILYATPLDRQDPLWGDANQDGRRDAIGDEFVEIINPHGKPIRLGGYKLVDIKHSRGSMFEFEFPPMELAPGGVAVVFNGYKSGIAEPYGDTRNVPPAAHKGFGGAWVFTARVKSRYDGLANAGDGITIVAPGGRCVQGVAWGELDGVEIPSCAVLVEGELTDDASIVRDPISGEWVEHPIEWAGVDGGAGGSGLPYSPGDAANGLAPPSSERPKDDIGR